MCHWKVENTCQRIYLQVMVGGVKRVPVPVNLFIVKIKGARDGLGEFKSQRQPEAFNLRALGCQSDHYHQKAIPNLLVPSCSSISS